VETSFAKKGDISRYKGEEKGYVFEKDDLLPDGMEKEGESLNVWKKRGFTIRDVKKG